MRTPFIAGNWKMNLTTSKARELVSVLDKELGAIKDIELLVAPPATALAAVIEELRKSRIKVAAQNCHWEASGAFTGEISPELIRELGCSHVIIGHSERRQYFGETDETVNKKIRAAFRAGLQVIACIGETLAQREAGETMMVVETQLKGALKGISSDQMKDLTVAYEPVWAIGTGKNATSEQAQEVHGHLRNLLKNLYGSETANAVRIQYGGSVKPSNTKELMGKADIDGALVGGASLEAASFIGIVKYRG
jgi:triosephosphate isomerase